MRNRILVVLLLMLLSCGFAQGQCTLNVTLNATDTSTQTSGGVDLSTLVLQGSGDGPSGIFGVPSFAAENFAYQSVTGDFTIIRRLTGITAVGSVSYPASDILALDSTGSFVTFQVQLQNGVPFYSVYGRRKADNRWFNVVGGIPNQQVTFPFWSKLTRVAGVYTPYTSQDGVSWTQVATGFSLPALHDPTKVGIDVYTTNQATAGDLAQATVDNISVNGVLPSFTDADFGTTGNVGSGEPNIPFTFTETLSGISLSYATTGSCTQPQLNAIASVETNGSYQVQNVFSLYDVSAQNFVIKNTDSETMGSLVCATCSEPGFPASATTSFLFADAPLGYTYFVAQDVFFDNNSYNTLAAQNVSLNNSGGSTEYDGHISITKAANEYMILEGPPLWKYQMGPYPNYACTTRSIGTTGPDYKPVTFWTEDPKAYLYYTARSWCKRPHGSAAGTAWVCTYTANILFPFGIKGTDNSTYVDCTNWDLNIKGIWP